MHTTKSLSYTTGENSSLFFQNPFPIAEIGDPFVLKTQNRYYMFATSSSNGYYCWQSDDLVNWNSKKLAYSRTAASWAQESFWAPEVVAYQGRYYMYYTAKGPAHSLRIGVAIANQPEGPYIDALPGPLFDFGYGAIDANVFIDTDGKKYIYYARDCSENFVAAVPTSQIYGAELSDDMLSLKSTPVLLTTPEQAWEKNSVTPLWNEGPEMLVHKGTYYMTYSGNCFAGRSYAVGYATASTPLGPFTKAEQNPILTSGSYANISGPGHHSFTTSPDDTELFMVYHSHTFPNEGGGNRQVNIDRIAFAADGSLFASGPTLFLQPMPSSAAVTNYALGVSALVAGTPQPLLTDGFFPVHKKDKAQSYTGTVDENGTLRITLTLPNVQTLAGISLYRGEPGTDDFATANIFLDNQFVLQAIPCPQDIAQRAATASFSPTKATTITITLTPKDGLQTVSLSEIMLLGCVE